MKKILLMCAFLVGISAMSYAQGGGRQRMSPEDQAKALQTTLSLTADQTAKVTAIYQDQAKKRDSVMTAANGDRQAMMQAIRPMMEATNAKIKAVLTTDDQKKAFDKWVEERNNRMRQGGGGGGVTPPPSQK
jgi:protein CpxP